MTDAYSVSHKTGEQKVRTTRKKPVRSRRAALWILLASVGIVVGIPLGWSVWSAYRFPSEHTPQGAYLRLVIAFGPGAVRDAFPYLEQEAKHALYTIHEYQSKSLKLVRSSFQEPQKSKWMTDYGQYGDAPDPEALWERMAEKRGWTVRMRKDLSGIAHVERSGARVTIETARGTRYPFRKGDDGVWGLTLFTADLVQQKQRAARDYEHVKQAAQDYQQSRQAP